MRLWWLRWRAWAWARRRVFPGQRLVRTADSIVWRRVLWRLWHCDGPLNFVPALPARGERPPMHFLDGMSQRPMCGAPIRGALWTIEWNAVTCARCKAEGLPVVLQHQVNDR